MREIHMHFYRGERSKVEPNFKQIYYWYSVLLQNMLLMAKDYEIYYLDGRAII